MEQHIFTVSQVNELIRSLLDACPPLGDLCIQGEVSNYKRYPSGHHFFSLKDSQGTLRCVMFRSAAQHLRFQVENGMQVLAVGRISVFPRDGAYQLYCDRITPQGAGDLAAAFEQLKEKLRREGLFDPGHKKPLPPVPERIALVTSGAGAAVRDMIRILKRRWPLCRVIVLPVQVQGERAPAEIAGALRYADRCQIADVIVTGRGGGSMEDLWAFNDERVARAIFACATPVISAVGHEPDVTIADFVADVRAATPSNAAELAVPDRREMLRHLRLLQRRMAAALEGRLHRLRQQLSHLAGKRVLRQPGAYLQDRRMELIHLHRRLGDRMEAALLEKRRDFAAAAAALDALSPMKVLGRGYACVRSDAGEVIRSSAQVQPGQAVAVQLGRGGFAAVVSTIWKEGDDGREKTDL